MLHIVQTLQEGGTTPNVDLYIVYFLKFIQSIVPTIGYDYTMDVNVQGDSHKSWLVARNSLQFNVFLFHFLLNSNRRYCRPN